MERHLESLPVFVALAIVYYWFLLDARYRLGWRIAGLVIALLVFQLAYLKYRNFIAETFGLALPISAALAALIPLGISFYTFEAISAIVDIKRRKAPAPVPAMSWSLFIMFFPHLVAGPIVRWRLLSPQFTSAKRLQWRNIRIGFKIFLPLGFFRSSRPTRLAASSTRSGERLGKANWSALLLALLGFYAQLYLDFSGYTDMGRGIARMLGFRLPLNFRGTVLCA